MNDEMTKAVEEVLIEHRVQHSAVLAEAIMTRLREGPRRPVIATEPVTMDPVEDTQQTHGDGVDNSSTL